MSHGRNTPEAIASDNSTVHLYSGERGPGGIARSVCGCYPALVSIAVASVTCKSCLARMDAWAVRVAEQAARSKR